MKNESHSFCRLKNRIHFHCRSILNAQRRAQQSAPAVDGIYGLSILFQEISTHRAETIYQHTRLQAYTTMHSIRFLIQTVAGRFTIFLHH